MPLKMFVNVSLRPFPRVCPIFSLNDRNFLVISARFSRADAFLQLRSQHMIYGGLDSLLATLNTKNSVPIEEHIFQVATHAWLTKYKQVKASARFLEIIHWQP
jgi:hypothetical protein